MSKLLTFATCWVGKCDRISRSGRVNGPIDVTNLDFVQVSQLEALFGSVVTFQVVR